MLTLGSLSALALLYLRELQARSITALYLHGETEGAGVYVEG
jgi:hypothetical protein